MPKSSGFTVRIHNAMVGGSNPARFTKNTVCEDSHRNHDIKFPLPSQTRDSIALVSAKLEIENDMQLLMALRN